MLKVTIPASEDYDPVRNEFIQYNQQTLTLEHSLVSLSKWEQKFKKPFLSKESKSVEEILEYIKCMTVTSNVPDDIYARIPGPVFDQITAYIKDSSTATTFKDTKTSTSRETVTSELIYYWMIALGIPFECQKWHLNRLLTLIRVCGIKNSPQKKMSRRELMAQNRALNASRRKSLGSSG